MAPKIKSELLRVQCYMTKEAYQNFSAEFDNFNDKRKERNEPKLSESGFCHLKLTGTFPRLRGAPHGNQNALARKNNSADDGYQNDTFDESHKPSFKVENSGCSEDNFDPPSTDNFDPLSTSPKTADNSLRYDVSDEEGKKNGSDSNIENTEQSKEENFHEKDQNELRNETTLEEKQGQSANEYSGEENPSDFTSGENENTPANLTDEIPEVDEPVRHPPTEIPVPKTEYATAAKKIPANKNINDPLSDFSDEVIDDLLVMFNDSSQLNQLNFGQAEMTDREDDNLAEEIASNEASLQITNGDNQAQTPEADAAHPPGNSPVKQARLF